jgi:hypothetical protein
LHAKVNANGHGEHQNYEQSNTEWGFIHNNKASSGASSQGNLIATILLLPQTKQFLLPLAVCGECYAHENLAIADGKGGEGFVAKLVSCHTLIFLRIGLEHKRFAGFVGGINLVATQHWRRTEIAT